jgi:hypothetical protein
MVEPRPNRTVLLNNLIPGKRYRMVVDVPATPSLSAPSIEFTVPPSPRLISTYTPTVKITNYQHPILVNTRVGDIPDYVNPVDKNYVSAISVFAGTGGSKNYRLTIPGRKPPKGKKIRVSGRSVIYADTDPLYYDWLDYTVDSISGDLVRCTAKPGGRKSTGEGSRVGWGKAPWNKNTGGFRKTQHWDDAEYNGKAFSDVDSSKSGMKASWSETTKGYQPDTIWRWELQPGFETRWDAEVSLPTEIVNSGVFNSTGNGNFRYLPVFFYIKNGIYYNMDDTLMTAPLALSTFPSVIPLNATDTNMANDTRRDYRFSIARYERQGASWVPEWMQVDTRYESNPVMSNVIISQPARRI